LSRLLDGQPGEKTQLDQFRLALVLLFELLQGLVQGEQIDLRLGRRCRDVWQFLAVPATAGLERALVSGSVDKYAPHRLRRGSEEMPPADPLLNLFTIDEAEVGFMHQGGGLERLTRLLVYQTLCRQLAQFVVDQWQELIGRVEIALFDGGQDARDFAHAAQNNWNHTPVPVGRKENSKGSGVYSDQ